LDQPVGDQVSGDRELADALRGAVARLHRRLRQSSAEGLTPSQVSLLATVRRRGNPTLGELASAERVQPPSVTRAVGRLEAEGLLERVPDPADRRVARVALTPAGSAALRRQQARQQALLAQRLGALDPDERASAPRLVALLEKLAGEL
jgi:DNA-binding MarR family transcriptional regulator